jgi:hypothetical protein
MCASLPIGRTPLRLDPLFRWTVYGLVAALFVTGAAWLAADALKDGSSGELWQAMAANLLMLHGGGAMGFLILFGALFALHVRRAWRSRKNRLSGAVMLAFNATLIVTSFGLYYLGSETLRPWASGIHLGIGLGLPVLFLVHVLAGRRCRQAS